MAKRKTNTDAETAEVLTALVRSPLMRQRLKDSNPTIFTDEIIDKLRIVPIGHDEPELPIWRER